MATLDALAGLLDEERRGAPCVSRVFEAAKQAGGDTCGWRLVRAPGRVNLIGEHTDYNGLPVMPMAIEREIVALFRPSGSRSILLRSANGFGERTFEVSGDIARYEGDGDWGNYAKAAVQELMRQAEPARPVGFEAVVDGDIPDGAGLSSSSALVVAMGLAFAAVNQLAIAPERMAEMMAQGEHYVGTRGGGMDQAACLLGEEGKALRMDFGPLRTRAVPLPAGARIVVADSLVKARKSQEEKAKFNLRAAECAMACALLGRHYGRPFPLLADFHAAFDDPACMIEGVLPPVPLAGDEIARMLGISGDEFDRRFLCHSGGAPLAHPARGFQPYVRARHVLTEATRVQGAEQAMRAGDLALLGRLMDESHASCRDDYEISCPELEALTEAARDSGALGARLTGAGFGGCIVALAKADEADRVLDGIRAHYYEGWLARKRPELIERFADAPAQAIFTSRPRGGAVVLGEAA